MISRNRSSFIVSVSLHLSAAALLFLFLSVSPRSKPLPKTLWIEIAQAPHASGPQTEAANSAPSSAHSHGVYSGHRVPQLKDLGVKYGWQPGASVAQASKGEAGDGTSHGVDLVSEGKELPLYKYLRDEVENNLIYPAELKKKTIQGTVSGALVFSKGEFVEDQTRLQSDSSFLRVAVMRALRRAFRESLPEKYWQLAANGEGRLEVQCRFVFATVEHDDDQTAQSLQAVSGRALAFYRTYVHSALQWKLGPLSGLGPLVSLDVLWIPEKIGELFSKKAEIDPLDSYRDDPAW